MSAEVRQYEKYLRRLYMSRRDNPEMDMLSSGVKRFTQPFSIINKRLQSALNVDNAGIGAKIIASLEGERQVQTMTENLTGEAIQAKSARIGGLDKDIATAESQLEAAKERERKAKAAKNTNILRKAIQVAGMAAAAILAIPTGGLTLAAIPAIAGAASLGGAIAQGVSGFTGIDENGHFSVDPEEWDMDTTIAGLQEAATIGSGMANDALLKKNLNNFTQRLPAIRQIIDGLTPQNADIFRFGLQNSLWGNGSIDEFLKGWSTEHGGNTGLNLDSLFFGQPDSGEVI